MKKKIFVNRFHLITSVFLQIGILFLSCMICLKIEVVWYIHIIVYSSCIILTFLVLIMPILKFIIFKPGELEVRDYKFFFRVKKTLIPISSIKKVDLAYRSTDGCDVIYYNAADGERRQLKVYNKYKLLKLFAEYMPDVKYFVTTVNDTLIDPIPQSHREVLAKLNVINKEPF